MFVGNDLAEWQAKGHDDDYEVQKLDAPPTGAEIHVENQGDANVVTSEAAVSGKKSVKFIDAQNLKRGYCPHLVYGQLNHTCARVEIEAELDSRGSLRDPTLDRGAVHDDGKWTLRVASTRSRVICDPNGLAPFGEVDRSATYKALVAPAEKRFNLVHLTGQARGGRESLPPKLEDRAKEGHPP